MNVLQRTWSELVPHVPEDGFAGKPNDMPGALELLLSCDPCSLTAGVSQPRRLPVREPPYGIMAPRTSGEIGVTTLE